MSRKKFQIYFNNKSAYNNSSVRTLYKPTGKNMLVMNNEGIFFVYNGEPYYPSIRKLSEIIGSYDVEWKE